MFPFCDALKWECTYKKWTCWARTGLLYFCTNIYIFFQKWSVLLLYLILYILISPLWFIFSDSSSTIFSIQTTPIFLIISKLLLFNLLLYYHSKPLWLIHSKPIWLILLISSAPILSFKTFLICPFFSSLIFSLFCDISILYILINDTSSLVEIPFLCTFHFYYLLHTFYPDTCFYILIHDNSSAY